MNDAAPNMTIYIAKLDGRNAVLEWKLPGLNMRAMMKKTPIRGLRVRQMTLHIKVWHKAQENARAVRIK
jgi:hypothetical protein